VSLTGTPPAKAVLHAGDLVAVAVDDLAGYIGRLPALLAAEQVDALARGIDSRLPGRTPRRSSLVEPDPLPPETLVPPPERQQPSNHPSYGSRQPYRTPPSPRRSPGRGLDPGWSRRRGQSATKVALVAVAALFGLVVCLAILGASLRALSHTHFTLPTIPAPAHNTATTPTTVAPSPLSVSWSCPSTEKGWTASFSWPAGHAPSSYSMIEVAPSADGPWTMKGNGDGSAPIQLRGVTPGTHEWVRAGSLISLEISGEAVMAGPITAPAGC
jgi:hypothetical protein